MDWGQQSLTISSINTMNSWVEEFHQEWKCALKVLTNVSPLSLPLVEKDWNFPLVGYDTRTNILSGVILGMAKEIDGMIDAYAEQLWEL